MELQGAMGLIQLKKLNEKNNNRIYNFNLVNNAIINDTRNNNIFYSVIALSNTSPAWFSLPFILDEKYENDYHEFLSYLTNNGVENRPVVTGNFARQPIMKSLDINIEPEMYKGAEKIHKRGFFIGLFCEKIDVELARELADIFFNFYKFKN